MQSRTAEPTIVETDEPAPAQTPPPLIFLEPADDAGVCAVDGECA
ncbi:hypothetical protein ACIA8K_39260 [Catenuloplanes sp. NPDC051500]